MRRLLAVCLGLALLVGMTIVVPPAADAGTPTGTLFCAIDGDGGEAKIVELRFGKKKKGSEKGKFFTPGDAARRCLDLSGHPVGIVLD